MHASALTRPLHTWRHGLGRIADAIGRGSEDLYRLAVMKLALEPCARLLPRRVGMATADALATPLLALPRPGVDAYWKMRLAFGLGRRDALRLARDWIARPFRDYLALRRIALGRDDPDRWRIVDRAGPRLRALRASGRSYLVTTMHGSREAYVATRSPRVTPGRIVQLGLDPAPPARSVHALRIRVQYGTIVRTLSRMFGRRVEFVAIGVDRLPAHTLLERLRAHGHVVMMDVDAARQAGETGTYQRPFAGLRSREFSTGPARLARTASCPIVSCVTSIEEDGSIVLDWSEPMAADADPCATMDRILDRFEVAIGERPAQYVRWIGGDRRWDPVRRRWTGP